MREQAVDVAHAAARLAPAAARQQRRHLLAREVQRPGETQPEQVEDERELQREAEEGDEYGTFEFVLFKAQPEVWYKELGATEEEATDIFISREFWINLRDKMVTPALKEIGGSHYPTMPLDMEKFGRFGTEDESQQLILYFSARETSSDEQIAALRATAEMWDDQEDIH